MRSNDPQKFHLLTELQSHQRVKLELTSAFPDLDDQTLADTLEGLTDLQEIIAAMIRSALDDEAMAEALSTRLADMKSRLDRIARRAKTKRSLVLDAMTKAEISKVLEPDFTATVRFGGQTMDVIDEAAIPEDYWLPQPPKLDRQRLLGDLKQDVAVAGVQLAPRTKQLSVRTK